MEGMTKLARNTSLFALVLAILIAALPPLFYFFLRHQYHFAVLETEAEMNGLLVTEIINASPEYWRYQHGKLEEIISIDTIKMPHETRSVLDSYGVVIARSGNEIKRPIITRSHNLYDSGNVVGRIEISRSLRPVLIDTLAVGIFSFFIGLSVFATLKIFPLRALSQTLQFLHNEKERAEEKEEKLRTVADTAQDAIIVMDHDGNISFWNPAAEKIFGYSSSEAIGKELHMLLAPQRYYETHRKGFEQYRKTGQGTAVGKTLELDAVRKGGGEFPIELSLSSMQIREKWHAVGIIRDISERKRAEEEVRKLNEELELKIEERTKQLLDAREELVRNEKLAVLGQLAGSVGHELRNPLGVMSNAIYFLKTVLTESDGMVCEYLNMIKTEIDNAERIISDLLDFSRTKTPQLQSIGTSELLSTSLGKCALPENVKTERNISDTLPLLRVDPFQLAQVFQNLILNACQAMSKGGELRIAARKITGGEHALPNVDFIEISVSDTGEGISPENMKVLFHPLFTTKAKGIGLGLVVSKRLTEANGGRIDVESRLGEGTTFTVILPCEGG